jgi:hypothetical protein
VEIFEVLQVDRELEFDLGRPGTWTFSRRRPANLPGWLAAFD